MKKITFLVLLSSWIAATSIAQNTFPSTGAAGIGTTSPNASSLLEVKSTTKGILMPRMSLTQRNAIASPATGLLIYQNNSTPGFYYYNGTAWTAVTASAGANGSLSNLTGPTAINTNLIPDGSNTRNFGSSTQRWNNGFFGGTLTIGAYILPSTDGTNGQILSTNGTGSVSWKTISGSSQWTTRGANISFSSGNVGIGTSSPVYKLDISGDINQSAGNVFRVGGTQILKFDATNTNLWIGGGGGANTTGSDNTASGYNALYFNTTGEANTTSGFYALLTIQQEVLTLPMGLRRFIPIHQEVLTQPMGLSLFIPILQAMLTLLSDISPLRTIPRGEITQPTDGSPLIRIKQALEILPAGVVRLKKLLLRTIIRQLVTRRAVVLTMVITMYFLGQILLQTVRDITT